MSGFDRDTACSTLGGPGILRAIAQVYVAELPVHISRLRADLASGNREALADTAHFIKGGLQALQARAAQSSAVALERHCREGSEPAEPLVEALIGSLESLGRDLNEFLSEHPGG